MKRKVAPEQDIQSDTPVKSSPTPSKKVSKHMKISSSNNITSNQVPLHLRRFTPHAYFSHTVRDVIANKESVIVIIPKVETEAHLRKKMFRIVRQLKIKDSKEYERQLRRLIETDVIIEEVKFTESLGKRYVHLNPSCKSSQIDTSIGSSSGRGNDGASSSGNLQQQQRRDENKKMEQ